MLLDPLASAIVGHLVGDYLFQNDYMALGKKKSDKICALHCLIWTVCVVACTPAFWHGLGLFAIPLLFISHYIQDRWSLIRKYMRLYGQELFATGPLSPWSIIAVDNVWHIVTIFVLLRLL